MSTAPLAGHFAGALEFPEESLRLLAECRDAQRREDWKWADEWASSVHQAIVHRTFHGYLWVGPKDEAVALARCEPAGEWGQRGWLYLAEGFQRRAFLELLLQRLTALRPDSPFLTWSPDLPGVPEADRVAAFERAGYIEGFREDLRYPKDRELIRVGSGPDLPERTLTAADEDAIARLNYRAYSDNPFDRLILDSTTDDQEAARRATWALLHDRYGPWLKYASFGIQDRGQLVAVTLANENEGGLISDVAVDPAYRRRGLARRLLCLTVGALRTAGFDTPRLVVTSLNTSALRLYLEFGFVRLPGGRERLWLNANELSKLRRAPSTG